MSAAPKKDSRDRKAIQKSETSFVQLGREVCGELASAESREWLKHNKGIPHEQVLAELGVTQEEIDQFRQQK